MAICVGAEPGCYPRHSPRSDVSIPVGAERHRRRNGATLCAELAAIQRLNLTSKAVCKELCPHVARSCSASEANCLVFASQRPDRRRVLSMGKRYAFIHCSDDFGQRVFDSKSKKGASSGLHSAQ